MKTSLILPLSASLLLSATDAGAALVAYWNFNGLSISTASTPGSGGVPTTIDAYTGAGTVALSNFGGLVDDFGARPSML